MYTHIYSNLSRTLTRLLSMLHSVVTESFSPLFVVCCSWACNSNRHMLDVRRMRVIENALRDWRLTVRVIVATLSSWQPQSNRPFAGLVASSNNNYAHLY